MHTKATSLCAGLNLIFVFVVLILKFLIYVVEARSKRLRFVIFPAGRSIIPGEFNISQCVINSVNCLKSCFEADLVGFSCSVSVAKALVPPLYVLSKFGRFLVIRELCISKTSVNDTNFVYSLVCSLLEVIRQRRLFSTKFFSLAYVPSSRASL